MDYSFPVINNISDVLPCIENRSEFVVVEKDYATIVNYVVCKSDTFDMLSKDDHCAKVRRECRGIMFNHDGDIISRPFHKFFNIGERPETMPSVISLSRPHRLAVKLDGSMVRPFPTSSGIRWGTKMGITDIALDAEVFVAKNPRYTEFAQWAIQNKLTPLFEWCSRGNRVVIDYSQESLTLLAVRDNTTGEYLDVRM